MGNKKYYQIGWRLNGQQRQALKERGLYVYANRSWDEGCGCTLEHRVIVNHENDVIMNFAALNENDREDRIDDFYAYVNDNDIEDDYKLYEDNKDILDY